MKKRTVSIGGATYDIFLQFNKSTLAEHSKEGMFVFASGDKIRADKVTESCGGGASNSAVGLARLGCDAIFSGILGDDQWGEKLLHNMQKEEVDTRAITIVENEISSFSIVLIQDNGDRTILYDPGTNEHLHDATFEKETICEMDWVILNHIQEHSSVIEDDIVEILCKNPSINLTWNPGGCQIDAGLSAKNNKTLLQQTTLLLLNDEEAKKFTKTDTAKEAIHMLLQSGAKNVCITNGSKGSLASDGEKLYKCPIANLGKVCDTTGAGDAFGTGVTWALLSGKDLPTALKAGSINAASVVCFIGAQSGLLTEAKMESKLREITLDVDVQTL